MLSTNYFLTKDVYFPHQFILLPPMKFFFLNSLLNCSTFNSYTFYFYMHTNRYWVCHFNVRSNEDGSNCNQKCFEKNMARFFNAFHQVIKRLTPRVERINDKIDKNEVFVLSKQACLKGKRLYIYIYIYIYI